MNEYRLDTIPDVQFYLVEITTACNLRCPGCLRTVERDKGNWNNEFMPLEKVKQVIDNMPSTHHVIFSGFGEVVFHPHLPEIIDYANASGKFRIIQINTNGVAKDIDYYQKLLDCGLNYLMVSIDSLDQEILDKCRTGTKVEQLEKILHGFADFRIPVITSITVSKNNLHDIPNTLRRLNEIGKFTVGIRQIGDLGQPEVMLDEAEKVQVVQNILSAMPLDNLRVDPPKYLMTTKEICVDPWTRPSINIKGELTPCCWTDDGSILDHIDMTDLTYEQAWHDPRHQTWLKDFQDNGYPDKPCKGCPRNPNAWKSVWHGKDFELYKTLG